MTDFQTPKFPPITTPEEMKAASEKVMNFWVGALSPMWVPFWAASSFGLSAWTTTQNMAKSESLLKDMPLAGKWPGFDAFWGKPMTPAEAEAGVESVVESVVEPAIEPVVETVKAAEADVADTVEAAMDSAVKAPIVVAEEAGALKQAAEDAVKTEMAEADATVESAASEVVAEAVIPKPIAKSVSAAKRTPRTGVKSPAVKTPKV